MRNCIVNVPLLLALVFAFFLPASYGQEEKQQPEAWAAVAIGTGGGVGGKTIQFDFRISKYTNDEQVDNFAEILKEKGQDALRRALEKENVGRINAVGHTGNQVRWRESDRKAPTQ